MNRSTVKKTFYIILALAFMIALLSPLASSNPDGLDWTIEKHAPESTGASSDVPAAESSHAAAGVPSSEAADSTAAGYYIFSDYKTPFIANEKLSTIISGFAGIIIILLFFKIYGRQKLQRHGQ